MFSSHTPKRQIKIAAISKMFAGTNAKRMNVVVAMIFDIGRKITLINAVARRDFSST